MFCPKCSHEQISDETRFCSRCGFELSVVKALLPGNDGDDSPQIAETERLDRSLRRRDRTVGASLMFIFALIIVAAITIKTPLPNRAPIVFLIVAWLALSLLINLKTIIQYFLRDDASADSVADDFSPARSNSKFIARNKKSLPESRGIPAEDFLMPGAGGARNTAEMVQPPSVTEETTNLLNK